MKGFSTPKSTTLRKTLNYSNEKFAKRLKIFLKSITSCYLETKNNQKLFFRIILMKRAILKKLLSSVFISKLSQNKPKWSAVSEPNKNPFIQDSSTFTSGFLIKLMAVSQDISLTRNVSQFKLKEKEKTLQKHLPLTVPTVKPLKFTQFSPKRSTSTQNNQNSKVIITSQKTTESRSCTALSAWSCFQDVQSVCIRFLSLTRMHNKWKRMPLKKKRLIKDNHWIKLLFGVQSANTEVILIMLWSGFRNLKGGALFTIVNASVQFEHLLICNEKLKLWYKFNSFL